MQRRARSGTLCKCEAPDSIGCSTQPIGKWLGQPEIKKNLFKSQMKSIKSKFWYLITL